MTHDIIRDYVPGDKDAVLEIWLQASRVGHPFLGEAALSEQYIQVRDKYLDVSRIFVAERAGDVAGFIGLLGEKLDFVGALFVLPTYHRCGIGRALIEYAAKWSSPIFVEVYARNEIAFPFYLKSGFVEESRRDLDDEGRPFEIVRLRLGDRSDF